MKVIILQKVRSGKKLGQPTSHPDAPIRSQSPTVMEVISTTKSIHLKTTRLQSSWIEMEEWSGLGHTTRDKFRLKQFSPICTHWWKCHSKTHQQRDTLHSSTILTHLLNWQFHSTFIWWLDEKSDIIVRVLAKSWHHPGPLIIRQLAHRY